MTCLLQETVLAVVQATVKQLIAPWCPLPTQNFQFGQYVNK